MKVELTSFEYKMCVAVAVDRMSTSIQAGLNHASTYERSWLDRTREEILGACGEMSVAKAVNLYWSPSVNTFHREPDIAPNIEVRTTHHDNGCLIVRDNDADDRNYFLVTGEPPVFHVRGWLRGSEARKDEWSIDPHSLRKAFFVPQSALNKLDEFQIYKSV